MSLVEMSVALFIIAITLAALGATLLGSLVAVDSNESRVRATALGNELVEDLVGLPWLKAALYTGEAAAAETASPAGLGLNATATFEGKELVRLADASPRDAQVPLARETNLIRNGKSFDVRRYVLWGDDAGTPASTRDYKNFVVTVTWSERGQLKQVRSEAVRSPTPEEEQVQSFGMTFSAINPGRDIAISDTGAIQTALDFVVTTTLETATAPKLSFPQRSGTASPKTIVMTNPAGDKKTWIAALGVGGAERFANGFVTFTAQGLNPLGQPVVATDQVVFLQTMGVQSFALSQSLTVCRSTRRLVSSTNVDVDVRGITDTDSVTITAQDSSVTGQAALPLSRNESGQVFRLVMPTTQTFTAATTSFTVQATRQRLAATLTPAFTSGTYTIGVNNSC